MLPCLVVCVHFDIANARGSLAISGGLHCVSRSVVSLLTPARSFDNQLSLKTSVGVDAFPKGLSIGLVLLPAAPDQNSLQSALSNDPRNRNSVYENVLVALPPKAVPDGVGRLAEIAQLAGARCATQSKCLAQNKGTL